MTADALGLDGRDDDLLVPVGLALGLHVLLVFALLLAGWLQPVPQKISVAGPPVEATLMLSEADIAVSERAIQEAPRPAPAPPPPPAPRAEEQPLPPQPVPQQQIPEPDTVDQEEVARLALQQAEEERRIQEERRRQQQIDLTERQRQEEAERKRQAREAELAEIRRQRDEAARRAELARQRLEQLADRTPPATPAPPAERPAQPAAAASGNNGVDTDLRARYVLAIQRAVERNWNRPETISPGAVCPLRIIQARGGTVISVEVLPGCAYDTLGQRSVEAAVLKAQPLPYEGFESVYTRDLRLNFRATEN
ncbi:cell envelope integrity protein TolA [Arenimonas composti]|uniref:Protein TolA n=1 Tax=Arenimonas composti TR7-09 = DSM 18010 TaxID=1121013 RepID=A0A091BEU9_9GAMM|nr:cell envelope integrity protein TolA [Arenimonas composti]KFN51228.1 hypothetical protein P873_02905 [Arenimonas composti TR7-09 = DSM 18010]